MEPIELLRDGLETWWIAELASTLGAFAVGEIGSPKSKPAEARAGSQYIVRFGSARLTGTSGDSRYHVCPAVFEAYGTAQGEASSAGAPLYAKLVEMERDATALFALQTGSITGIRVGSTRVIQLSAMRWRVEYDVRFTMQTSRG